MLCCILLGLDELVVALCVAAFVLVRKLRQR